MVNIATGNHAGTGGTKTVNIANGTPVAGGANVVNIGSAAQASALNLKAGTGHFTLDGAATTNYTIVAATTSGTITIGGTAQTGAIAIGDTAASIVSEISIGGGNGVKNINIGDGAAANVITIGNLAATTVSITDDNWSITAAGNAAFAKISGSVTTVTNLAATDTISSANFVVLVKSASANANVTLTSNPSIANGATGQLIILRGSHNTETITLSDSTNGIQLGAATRVLGANDTLTLVYDGTDWIEVAFSDN